MNEMSVEKWLNEICDSEKRVNPEKNPTHSVSSTAGIQSRAAEFEGRGDYQFINW